MNIALVTEFFPPYVTGGAEIFLSALAEHLRSRGHKVVVITTEQGQGKGKFKTYRLKSSPVRVSHRYQFHGVTLPWMFGNRKLVKNLEGIYKKEGIDLVYINNMFHLSFAPLQAAETAGLPVVLDVHDYWPICFSKDMLHKSEPYTPCTGGQGVLKCSRCLARKMGLSAATPALVPGLFIEKRLRKKWLSSSSIRKVICHSDEGVKELRKHGLESVSITYPYLGTSGRHKESKDDVFRMIFVSRLERVRGAHLLPEIARKLRDSGMEFRIDVIGRGSLAKELDRKDLGIHVHGFMARGRFEYFRKANCLLALQRYPVPHGITVIEAMAHELPVVAFKNCGAGFLVEKNNAGLTAGSMKGILSSIERLHSDRGLVRGIRKSARKNLEYNDKAMIFGEYERLLLSATQ
jgi:glycosyltransferase involved in cell wall biosynthesis